LSPPPPPPPTDDHGNILLDCPPNHLERHFNVEKRLRFAPMLSRAQGVTDHDERFALKRAPRECAERERQALIRLKRADQECQHVVRLHDHIEEARGGGGGSWLVLELGEISLSLWLRERGHAPSWVETLDVGHAIGNALAFVHG
jgi:hypothetical protein